MTSHDHLASGPVAELKDCVYHSFLFFLSLNAGILEIPGDPGDSVGLQRGPGVCNKEL